jgi:uncharacterized repeat protein (TIGR01451 family)
MIPTMRFGGRRRRPVARFCGCVLTLALVVLAAAPAAAAIKEELHQEMLQLAGELQQLKPRAATESAAAARYEQALARYREISRSMGGDDPGQVLGPEGAAAPPRQRGGGPPTPPGCVGSTSVFTNSTPLAIPTGPAVVSSTVVVAGAGGYLWNLTLSTTLTHTFAADLDITLMSPAGTVVTLTTDNGAGNDNVFAGTLWDDDANPGGQVPYVTNNGLTTDHAYVNLTLASPLVPEEAMAAFQGEDPNGTWTITISDDLAGDGGSLDTWTLTLTTFPAPPATVAGSATNNTPLAIPTGPAVVSSTLAVAGAGTGLCGMNLTTNLTHTFAADLDMTLQSPAGTVITLTTDNGAGNDNVFAGTVWDDDANPGGQVPYVTNNGLVTDHAYVNLTLASPLVPEEALGAFLGEDPNGTWTITISDDLAGDGGSLDSWTLDFETCSCATDLAITKTDGVATAVPGQSVVYTIVASNNGPSADPAATVADTFPPALTCTWTCVGAGGATCTANGAGDINDVINLPVGGTATYTATCQIDPAATGNLVNTASVSSSIVDTTPGNNSQTDTDTLTPQADLSITKTDGLTDIGAGQPITYTIVVSNAGPSDAPGVTVTDTFPPELTGVTWTCVGAGGGTCTANGAGDINDTANLPAGASVTYTVNATVDAGASGDLTNTASVTPPPGVTDPTPANDAASDVTTVMGGGGGDGIPAIPTLGELGLGLLALLLAALAMVFLRRRVAA